MTHEDAAESVEDPGTDFWVRRALWFANKRPKHPLTRKALAAVEDRFGKPLPSPSISSIEHALGMALSLRAYFAEIHIDSKTVRKVRRIPSRLRKTAKLIEDLSEVERIAAQGVAATEVPHPPARCDETTARLPWSTVEAVTELSILADVFELAAGHLDRARTGKKSKLYPERLALDACVQAYEESFNVRARVRVSAGPDDCSEFEAFCKLVLPDELQESRNSGLMRDAARARNYARAPVGNSAEK